MQDTVTKTVKHNLFFRFFSFHVDVSNLKMRKTSATLNTDKWVMFVQCTEANKHPLPISPSRLQPSYRLLVYSIHLPVFCPPRHEQTLVPLAPRRAHINCESFRFNHPFWTALSERIVYQSIVINSAIVSSALWSVLSPRYISSCCSPRKRHESLRRVECSS